MVKTASGEEAAAVAAAIERFVAETAVAVEAPEAVGPWQRAALIEGVGAKGAVQDLRGLIRRSEMAVVKIIELVGSSKTSTDDAAKQALSQAQGTLRNIRAVDIVSTGIRGENLDEYRAHVRVAFLIEGTEVD